MLKIKNKNGRGNGALWFIGVTGVVIALVLGLMLFGVKPQKQEVTPTLVLPDKPIAVAACQTQCPSDTDWSGVVTIQNKLNTTGIEGFDTTAWFYKLNADGTTGAVKSNPTDTTAGAVTLACGESYVAKIASTSGAAGDDSYLLSSSLGKSDGNGNILLTACGAGDTFTIQGKQHGLWETRGYDLIANGYMNNQTNGTTTAWKTGNTVYFTRTTDGGDAAVPNQSVATGGEFNVRLDARAAVDDQDLNDRGIYVLLDMGGAVWVEPTVIWDTKVQKNIKGELTPDETIAYAAYEYAYKIPAEREIVDTRQVQVNVQAFALSGIDPVAADTPIVCFAPIGQFESTLSDDVLRVASASDDSARTAIHTLQCARFGVS